jgi:hypothetical protein
MGEREGKKKKSTQKRKREDGLRGSGRGERESE